MNEGLHPNTDVRSLEIGCQVLNMQRFLFGVTNNGRYLAGAVLSAPG